MVKTVPEGFREFHSRLTPTGTESEAAKKHRASIKDCLEKYFGMTSFFRTGSFGNGTSIRGESDVDYFAVLPRNNLKNQSSITLREMKNVLDTRFPNTGVSVRTPAVCVPFGTNGSESTEVVPAYYIKNSKKGYNIYGIPNGTNGWTSSSPSAHNTWITQVNKEKNLKVKPLVRFLKAWKYFRNVPISSFYLELRVTKYASGEEYIEYSFDVRKILKQLYDNSLAGIQDPLGISGIIPACQTEAKKEDTYSKLQSALIRANKAREAEKDERIPDAFTWWNLVFGGYFPAY